MVPHTATECRRLRWLETDFGFVNVGTLGDLVLFDANQVENIENTRQSGGSPESRTSRLRRLLQPAGGWRAIASQNQYHMLVTSSVENDVRKMLWRIFLHESESNPEAGAWTASVFSTSAPNPGLTLWVWDSIVNAHICGGLSRSAAVHRVTVRQPKSLFFKDAIDPH